MGKIKTGGRRGRLPGQRAALPVPVLPRPRSAPRAPAPSGRDGTKLGFERGGVHPTEKQAGGARSSPSPLPPAPQGRSRRPVGAQRGRGAPARPERARPAPRPLDPLPRSPSLALFLLI